MDEGVAGYMAYTALSESTYQDSIQAWHELQFATVRKALAEGSWISIRGLSIARDWGELEAARPGLVLAESYVVASYLVANYGLAKCIDTYKGLSSNSYSAEATLFSNTGLTFERLEENIRAWLTEIATT